MKKTLLAFALLLSLSALAQTENPNYDKKLAESLGADAYGMKPYVLVILKSGPNQTKDKAELNRLFRGHMDNITRLSNEGKLVVAGPLGENAQSYRGIFIFNVKTVEEAKALVATDPAVSEKLFEAEMYQWYGSAALPEYLKTHAKIEKMKH